MGEEMLFTTEDKIKVYTIEGCKLYGEKYGISLLLAEPDKFSASPEGEAICWNVYRAKDWIEQARRNGYWKTIIEEFERLNELNNKMEQEIKDGNIAQYKNIEYNKSALIEFEERIKQGKFCYQLTCNNPLCDCNFITIEDRKSRLLRMACPKCNMIQDFKIDNNELCFELTQEVINEIKSSFRG